MSARVFHKGVPQERLVFTSASHKSECSECPTRVSYKSVPAPQERPTTEFPTRLSRRASYKSECPMRVSHKSFPQERGSNKSVAQKSPTRVFHKGVPQECLIEEVPDEKSVLQERPQKYPTRVPYRRSVRREECPHKSVSYTIESQKTVKLERRETRKVGQREEKRTREAGTKMQCSTW